MIIPQKKLISFKHSGDAGDLIYGLVAIKGYLQDKAVLYLNTRSRNRTILEDGTKSLFTEEKVNGIISLLEKQDYIEEVVLWNHDPINVDMDMFRRFIIGFPKVNIAEAQLRHLHLPLNLKDEKWLDVESLHIADIVIARSKRYRNPSVWNRDLKEFIKNRAIFIGHPDEYLDFRDNILDIPYYETQDLHEVAQVISGSRIFIGNQSSPMAICEGLKHNCIQETCTYVPNCVFQRKNAIQLWNGVNLDKLIEFERMI